MPGTVIPYNRINPKVSPADVLVLGLAKGCHDETFVVTDAYCVDPGCECNLATLRLSELMEDGSQDPEPLNFHLHLETHELLELSGNPLKPEEGSLLHNFLKDMPEEGLDLWKKHALEAKAWGKEHAWEIADFSELEPGEMLTPSRLWPDTPQDTLTLGESRYGGIDYYCPSPTCDCQEVRLDLFPEGQEDAEAPDAIRLDLRWEFKGKVHLEEATGIAPQTVKPFLKTLAQDKALLAQYRERYKRIKEAGTLLASRYPALAQAWGMRSAPKPSPASAPKVGRNEPCPCGSGKKFKQCCGK